MPLTPAGILLRRRLAQHGLGELAAAGAVCRQAELLCPGMFRAVSLRQGVLHLELAEAQLLPFKLIQGRLLQDLEAFSTGRHLPTVSRVKLTIQREPANL